MWLNLIPPRSDVLLPANLINDGRQVYYRYKRKMIV
jgi:hypothetical protein